MAALTLPPVLTQVHIVLFMAGEAGRVQPDLVGRLLVTALACELAVSTLEGESRLLAVIELPLAPPVRRMTLGARRPQASMVHVIALVTIVALVPGIAVLARIDSIAGPFERRTAIPSSEVALT